MSEKKWTDFIKDKLKKEFDDNKYEITCGEYVPYSINISSNEEEKCWEYETDLLIKEKVNGKFIPRLIIESKYNDVTTHDIITYSQKAFDHKNLYYGLRYGMMIGKLNKITPKVLKHGNDFDFIIVFKDDEPTEQEWNLFVELVKNNLEIASEYAAFMEDNKNKNVVCIEKNMIFHSIKI